MELYDVVFKKANTGDVKYSVRDWSVGATGVEFKPMDGVKKLHAREWPEEDGEDVYVPDELKLAAYDWELELCYKGEAGGAYYNLCDMQDWLLGYGGHGPLMEVYCPWTGQGVLRCYLKQFAGDDFWRSADGEYVKFKITLRVTNPERITLD